MEPQHTDQPSITNNNPQSFTSLSPAPLHQVTPLSKILAAVLFISLPFVGGYVGWKVGKSESIDTNPVVTTLPSPLDTDTLATGTQSVSDEVVGIQSDSEVYTLSPLIAGLTSVTEGDCSLDAGSLREIFMESDFTDLPLRTLACEEIDIDGNRIIALLAPCGGCVNFFLFPGNGNIETLKLQNFQYFSGHTFKKTPALDEYLSITANEIYKYDLRTDSKTTLYTAKEHELLLWCEHGCGYIEGNQTIQVANGEVILEVLTYDARIEDPLARMTAAKRVAIPLSV